MRSYRRATGFTIVELLIVIVVIGIIAAIAIIAYTGIQQRARIAVLQSDLSSAAKQLEIDKTLGGSYPGSTSAANNGAGLNKSDDTTYEYTSEGSSYCLTGTNNGVSYYVSNTSLSPKSGVCSGHLGNNDPPVNSGVVTTFAGGTYGTAEGTGTGAQFMELSDIAVDSGGNVYVSDAHRIRKITPAGVTSTLAGSTVPGFTNGTGAAARFDAVKGIDVDNDGNVYAVDAGNRVIRKITPAGVVTTLAGSGAYGNADGTGTAAQFSSPIGITVDSTGNVYVADNGSARIRKITPAGVVTTLAGSNGGHTDATGASAQFEYPVGITADNTGNLYIGDLFRVRKVTPIGVVTTIAGSGEYGDSDGVGTTAEFRQLTGVTIMSDGTLYVINGGETDRFSVRKITPAGLVTTLAGGQSGYADGTGMAARFGELTGIDVDSSGALYVTDGGFRIRKIE